MEKKKEKKKEGEKKEDWVNRQYSAQSAIKFEKYPYSTAEIFLVTECYKEIQISLQKYFRSLYKENNTHASYYLLKNIFGTKMMKYFRSWGVANEPVPMHL